MMECSSMHMHTRIHSCPILHCFFIDPFPLHQTSEDSYIL